MFRMKHKERLFKEVEKRLKKLEPRDHVQILTNAMEDSKKKSNY